MVLRRGYFPVRYRRSPAGFVLDSTVMPIFLRRVPLMKPRMLWFCQFVASAISAKVAPLGRRRSSRIVAFLDPSRASIGAGEAFLLVGRTGFFAAWAGLAAFFGAVCLARLLAFGSPFFRLAALFAAFSGATWAPCSATAAVLVLVVASVFVIVVVILVGG